MAVTSAQAYTREVSIATVQRVIPPAPSFNLIEDTSNKTLIVVD